MNELKLAITLMNTKKILLYPHNHRFHFSTTAVVWDGNELDWKSGSSVVGNTIALLIENFIWRSRPWTFCHNNSTILLLESILYKKWVRAPNRDTIVIRWSDRPVDSKGNHFRWVIFVLIRLIPTATASLLVSLFVSWLLGPCFRAYCVSHYRRDLRDRETVPAVDKSRQQRSGTEKGGQVFRRRKTIGKAFVESLAARCCCFSSLFSTASFPSLFSSLLLFLFIRQWLHLLKSAG
mmetsp:Transcript_20714/g.57235  ORF Transcript_20714/g.57235 Transcript_20714/m.57235 type:complete len:236 (-) Transcript_20714:344-1051(-)